MALRCGIRFPLSVTRTVNPWLIQCVPVNFYSTSFIGDKPLLVRDFIRAALYDPKHGYFSKTVGPVGVLERSIRFNQIKGRDAYIQFLDKIYREHDVAWFTPVELFKPWYGHAIAEAILRTANLSVPLKIYEIGGGSGTCAKCILDYMMLNAPERVYNNMTYISVEISPSLAKKQLEVIGEYSSHLNRYRVEQRDASDRSGWHADPNPCWVIMLEVLDNLPHDLVYSPDQVSPWMEAWVEKAQDSLQVSEIYKPLQDTLISQCVKIIDMDKSGNAQPSQPFSIARKIMSKIFPKPRKAWVPTGSLRLLEVLHWALPKMSLIASDYSYLPDVRIMGDRAPLVCTKKDGITVDRESYLDAEQGDCDIFFPTDFWLLERIDHHCSRFTSEKNDSRSSKLPKLRRGITLDTAAFIEQFGLPSKTKTKDGYNPLLDDFKNTKFYLSVPTHNIIVK